MENFELFGVDDQVSLNVVAQIAEELIRPGFEFGRDIPVRNEDYFEEVVPKYSDDEFRKLFRMSRVTYEVLVDHIKTHKPEEHRIKTAKKVLISVYILATQSSFNAAGDKFNLSSGTTHYIFKEVIEILCSCVNEFIKWPEDAQFEAIAESFKEKSGFPGVIGAIDGCHIAIKQPIGNANDFYNRHGYHSIILQGTCDHTLKFIDVFIGLPGRMHDARVYRSSPLFEVANRLPNNYHLLGDSAYPLSKNLLTPYRDNGHLNNEQINYYNKLSITRSTIERAFGLLKTKFRRLKYLDVQEEEMANKIIAACCVLHNFLIMHNEINFQSEDCTENELIHPPFLALLHEDILQEAVFKRDVIASRL